jgi:hypothetical protein
MEEWNGEWSSLEEWQIGQTMKARAAFGAWLADRKKRKQNRDKAFDRYLAKRRKRNGRPGTV